DFVKSPESTLRQVCGQLDLPWDPAMLTWPKAPEEIADRRNGNGSLWNSRDTTLAQTLERYRAKSDQLLLPAADSNWLESEFRDFNKVSGYPLHWNTLNTMTAATSDNAAFNQPTFEVTRR